MDRFDELFLTSSERKSPTKKKTKLPLHLTLLLPKRSPCKMPSARVVAKRRALEQKNKEKLQRKSLKNIQSDSKEEALIQSEEENLKFLESQENALDLNRRNYTFDSNLSVNPGVDMKSIQFPKIITDSDMYISFLRPLIDRISKIENDDHLSSLIDIVLEEVIEIKCQSRTDLLNCFTLLLLILLDKKCRLAHTALAKRNVLHDFLIKEIDSLLNMFDLLADTVMEVFTDAHDRLYIANCLESSKISPSLIATNPLHFSNRLSRHILIKSLCDLIGYNLTESTDNINTFECLKKIMLAGNMTGLWNLNSIYVLIKILYGLNSMMHYKNESDMVLDQKARNKCFTLCDNLTKQYIGNMEDYCVVKLLCAQTTWLWRKNYYEE